MSSKLDSGTVLRYAFDMLNAQSKSKSIFWNRVRYAAGVATIFSAFALGLILRLSPHTFWLFMVGAILTSISFIALIHADRRYDALNGRRYWDF